jgi:alpha-L-fucosidase
MLIRGAFGDGNVLLNVGPRPDGVIDPAQANLLKEIGDWLAKNGESIFGTRGGPFEPGEYGGTTRTGKTVYVHILKWPVDGALILPNLKAKLVRSRLLSGGQVDVQQSDSALKISVPASARQKIDTVLALDFDGDVMKLSASPVTPARELKP